MMFGVPTMYRRLATAAVDDEALAKALAGARLLVSGSAALPQVDHDAHRGAHRTRVLERYGMTETLMNTAVGGPTGPQPGYVGRPLDGRGAAAGGRRRAGDRGLGRRDLRRDRGARPEPLHRVPQPPGRHGGGLPATAGSAPATWPPAEPTATSASSGAATDLIKSGGYKIGAGEIEDALLEHPAVAEAAVTGEPDADLGERVVAWVVARPRPVGRRPRSCSTTWPRQLAPHKRPRVVRFLDELPRNEMGKVQKKRLGA